MKVLKFQMEDIVGCFDDDPHVSRSIEIVKRQFKNDHDIYLCATFFVIKI